MEGIETDDIMEDDGDSEYEDFDEDDEEVEYVFMDEDHDEYESHPKNFPHTSNGVVSCLLLK